MTEKKQLTAIQQLDEVLKIANATGFFFLNIHVEARFKEKGLEVDLLTIDRALNKLFKDGYIMWYRDSTLWPNKSGMNIIKQDNPIYNAFVITFEGSIFCLRHGYAGQTSLEAENKRTLTRMSERVDLLNFWVAFGTVGLLLLEVLKWWYQIHHHLKH